MGLPQPFLPGPQLIDGSKLNTALAAGLSSYTDSIVALAGGGATGATQLTSIINRVTTVATANDSVMMPVSAPGTTVKVLNSGANTLKLFANTVSALQSGVLDTLNGTAGATGITVAAGQAAELSCYSAGAWLGAVALA
jgi:hypothetical protein